MSTETPRFGLLALAMLAAISAQAADIDAEAMVAEHNAWRAQVGVTEPLRHSPALAATAQAWADSLKRKHDCRMHHSQADGKYGENLYWASALQWSDGRKEVQTVSARRVVAGWGSEKEHYDPVGNRCAPGKVCGHYTQIVWRDSTEVGCGMAVCEDSLEQVWVCRYQPAGNRIGKKPY